MIYPNPKPRVSFPSWAILISDRDLPSQNGGKNTRARKHGRKPGSCPAAVSLCVLSTAAGQALSPILGSRVPCPSPAPSGDTDFGVSTVPPGCHHPGLEHVSLAGARGASGEPPAPRGWSSIPGCRNILGPSPIAMPGYPGAPGGAGEVRTVPAPCAAARQRPRSYKEMLEPAAVAGPCRLSITHQGGAWRGGVGPTKCLAGAGSDSAPGERHSGSDGVWGGAPSPKLSRGVP